MSTRVTAVCCNMTSISANQCFIMSLITTQADHYLWDCVSGNLWIWPLLTNKWVAWYGFVLLTNLLFVFVLHYSQRWRQGLWKNVCKCSAQCCCLLAISSNSPSSSPSPPYPIYSFYPPSYLPFLLSFSPLLFLPILLPLPRQATLLVEQ